MRVKFLMMLIFTLFLFENLKALEVETFAENQCWLSDESKDLSSSPLPEEGEVIPSQIKLVSFNDNVSVTFTRDEILYYATEENNFKKKLKKPLTKNQNGQEFLINYHCGSYGHSVIVMDTTLDLCAWMFFKDGNWQIRSQGILGPHEIGQKNCHGARPGSLLLNIKDARERDLIKDDLIKNHSDEILKLTDISSRLIKIDLKEKYIGEEKSVREKLLKSHFVGPRSDVEFNWFSHPVGEFKE